MNSLIIELAITSNVAFAHYFVVVAELVLEKKSSNSCGSSLTQDDGALSHKREVTGSCCLCYNTFVNSVSLLHCFVLSYWRDHLVLQWRRKINTAMDKSKCLSRKVGGELGLLRSHILIVCDVLGRYVKESLEYRSYWQRYTSSKMR